MIVDIICNKCTSETSEGGDCESFLMELDGPLYRNIDHKLETQGYKCPRCKTQVSVTIDWSKNDPKRPTTKKTNDL